LRDYETRSVHERPEPPQAFVLLQVRCGSN
jgi:hypothetical protein